MKLLVVAVAFVCGAVLAEPLVTENQCHKISKYSVEVSVRERASKSSLMLYSQWFEENTKPEWRFTSLESTALFYSQGLSSKAKAFASQAAKVTIWVRRTPVL